MTDADNWANCWFGHRWTKWVVYDRSMFFVRAGQKFAGSEQRQKRFCNRCGYTQDVLVR